jgi:large subunit ribosomal protein L10
MRRKEVNQVPVNKERRGELIAEYTEWFKQSQAIVIAGYQGVSTKDLYRLRSKIHEAQGQLHVVKNTLAIKALQQAGLPAPEDLLTGSVIMSFGFSDPAAVAKAVTAFAGEVQTFKVKGGLLGNRVIDAAGVKALAELPPRKVLLGGLVATIQGPMSQLVNVFNAPLRELVQVLKARSEQTPAEA